MSNLQPLKWTQNNYAGIVTHTAKSPLHDYTIRYDDLEGAYLIDYYERMTNEHGNEFFKSVDEAKNWAQSTHYRDKMQPHVKPDSITDIRNWFKAAKPEPTNKDRATQLGCVVEEFAELMDSVGLHGTARELTEVADMLKEFTPQYATKFINRINKIEALDATSDITVTVQGFNQLMGFDGLGAQREVIRSNNSKMVKGKFEFDDNGKIAKPDSYSEPDLTPFLNKGE